MEIINKPNRLVKHNINKLSKLKSEIGKEPVTPLARYSAGILGAKTRHGSLRVIKHSDGSLGFLDINEEDVKKPFYLSPTKKRVKKTKVKQKDVPINDLMNLEIQNLTQNQVKGGKKP